MVHFMEELMLWITAVLQLTSCVTISIEWIGKCQREHYSWLQRDEDTRSEGAKVKKELGVHTTLRVQTTAEG